MTDDSDSNIIRGSKPQGSVGDAPINSPRGVENSTPLSKVRYDSDSTPRGLGPGAIDLPYCSMSPPNEISPST